LTSIVRALKAPRTKVAVDLSATAPENAGKGYRC
jgi:hypothetical protein